MLHSDGINILSLKESKATITSGLDFVTHSMLGAIALGMPALTKKFHQIVLLLLRKGMAL